MPSGGGEKKNPGAEAGAGAYIAAWQPSSVSATAAGFARAVVERAGPHGRQRAKNLPWAAGKLAGYAAGLGLEPVPEAPPLLQPLPEPPPRLHRVPRRPDRSAARRRGEERCRRDRR